MTFGEFFKKKKISLQLLQQGEPALFLEFEKHYEQMGEKSFDHTKKYWFNQLRRRFPAPVEVKVEKVIIENPLAEQTIAESLTEPVTPVASVGFKPRFKAGISKPTEEKAAEPVQEEPTAAEEKPAIPAPGVGFKPRFKESMVQKSTVDETVKPDEPEQKKDEPIEENPVESTPKPVGFKPRFNAKNIKPKE